MVNVPSIEQLTENQRVCLRMVLTRHSSKEIAIELGISESAVNKRLERAVQQLGASSRFAAARMLAAAEGEKSEHQGADDALAAYVEEAPGSPAAPDSVGVVQRLLGIASHEDGSRPRNTLGWSGRLAAIAALMLLVAMAFVALLSMGQTLTSMVADRTVVGR